MIPPVEERKKRGCGNCVFDLQQFGSPYCRLLRQEKTMIRGDMYPDEPCKYHIRPEEFKELIDSGVIG